MGHVVEANIVPFLGELQAGWLTPGQQPTLAAPLDDETSLNKSKLNANPNCRILLKPL
jgi:hypothetical protein